MRIQRLAVALTVINLGLMMFVVAQMRPAVANDIAPVLRGRALEIVDAQGRVRASITVEPPVVVDGRPYPETVLLRMRAESGGPAVKLQASVHGAGMRLADGTDTGAVVVAAQTETGSLVRVTDRNGREQLLRP